MDIDCCVAQIGCKFYSALFPIFMVSNTNMLDKFSLNCTLQNYCSAQSQTIVKIFVKNSFGYLDSCETP